ncbi:epoxide hydrolase N-terminal domain-containing protein [Antribacter sp. KLBMP9083]|uniref:Epoxide hydrolase N-terminal domain-containing protein n=1 Tax=Antribacter soli TaxID=2910976 RepID=A0AA41QH55_9MICO|nr:epoxide hydrolase N-terminal domain-containing protein [Antribacter soli]MCF4123052.1 epoxide hydrolase N-terminal domain-containing protein [Antribacter soli]
MAGPTPFSIAVPDEVLTDLAERLAGTRFVDDSPRRPPSRMSVPYLRDLVRSWRTWDWRARERWLNGHPQFTADLATPHSTCTRVPTGRTRRRCS